MIHGFYSIEVEGLYVDSQKAASSSKYKKMYTQKPVSNVRCAFVLTQKLAKSSE